MWIVQDCEGLFSYRTFLSQSLVKAVRIADKSGNIIRLPYLFRSYDIV